MTLDERINKIDLKHYPEWYRPRLERAIKLLGTKWPLHPANTLKFRRAA